MMVKSILKSSLMGVLGERRGERTIRVLGEAYRKLSYDLSPAGRSSKRALQLLKDSHRGERCVIIGNGPSLKKTDMSLIQDVFTFGLNRIYLNFENMGYETSCLVSVNPNIVEQWGDDFSSLDLPKFLEWNARRVVPIDSNTVFLRSVPGPKFSTDIPREGVWQGATVTFVALQLAFYMGFKEVVLIGVDHSFSTEGPANKLVTASGPDENHFHPGYFGSGSRWELPDLMTSEIAYKLAKETFEENDRTVIDATVGGKLQVFEKGEYQTIFADGARVGKSAV